MANVHDTDGGRPSPDLRATWVSIGQANSCTTVQLHPFPSPALSRDRGVRGPFRSAYSWGRLQRARMARRVTESDYEQQEENGQRTRANGVNNFVSELWNVIPIDEGIVTHSLPVFGMRRTRWVPGLSAVSSVLSPSVTLHAAQRSSLSITRPSFSASEH